MKFLLPRGPGLHTAQPDDVGVLMEARRQLSTAPDINTDRFRPKLPGTKIRHFKFLFHNAGRPKTQLDVKPASIRRTWNRPNPV